MNIVQFLILLQCVREKSMGKQNQMTLHKMARQNGDCSHIWCIGCPFSYERALCMAARYTGALYTLNSKENIRIRQMVLHALGYKTEAL